MKTSLNLNKVFRFEFPVDTKFKERIPTHYCNMNHTQSLNFSPPARIFKRQCI